MYEGKSFYRDKGKWWANYQINDLVVFILKGLTINCLNV